MVDEFYHDLLITRHYIADLKRLSPDQYQPRKWILKNRLGILDALRYGDF